MQRQSNRRTPAPGSSAAKGPKGKEALEARALAILEDTERYDYDTRHAVHVALRNVKFHSEGGGAEKYMPAAEARAGLPDAERALREVVSKAEAGETVEQSGVDAKYDDAARRVLGLMFGPGIPDFVSQGIYDVLRVAEGLFGIKLWRSEIDEYVESGGFSVQALARTFAQHPGQTFKLEIEKTLPELLAAVLAHDDTPAVLHNAIHDALGDLPGFNKALSTAPYLAELLRISAEIERGEGKS
jgi:hypothetical protein